MIRKPHVDVRLEKCAIDPKEVNVGEVNAHRSITSVQSLSPHRKRVGEKGAKIRAQKAKR